jgi:RNA polymerase sigma-70 factor (ECF subfamily)
MAVEKKSVVVAYDAVSLKAGLVLLVPELYARATRLCNDRALAEDLVQDTIERALKFAAQYERGTNLRAWAYQILFSVFVTRYRRQRREKNALKSLAGDPYAWTVPTAFAPCEATTPLTRTTTAELASLPEGFRAVLVMVDLEEMSYRDAAEQLGVPIGTVMSRLHRGRRLLAEKMQAHDKRAA